MKIRHTTVLNPKTGEEWEEFRDISLEQHIAEKLVHVGRIIAGEEKMLDVTRIDVEKYSVNKSVLTSEKITAIERLFALQQKHADIKALIKSRTTHEELDEISWTDFKKKFLLFFSKEY